MNISLHQNWMDEESINFFIERIKYWNLIKYDSSRSILLTNGKTTDLYLNLRNYRNNHNAIIYLSHLLLPLIEKLNPDKLAGIPISMSGILGHLSVISKKPYIEIINNPKKKWLNCIWS